MIDGDGMILRSIDILERVLVHRHCHQGERAVHHQHQYCDYIDGSIHQSDLRSDLAGADHAGDFCRAIFGDGLQRLGG